MREIKFRTPWFSKDGIFHGYTYWGYLGKRSGFVTPSRRAGLIKKDDEQYIGLKDKSGKEIYEGDIVRFVKNGTYPNFYAFALPVTFQSERGFHPYFQGLGQETTWMPTLSEVIGNVHENPELLETHK